MLQIPLYYQELYKRNTKDVMKFLTDTCVDCHGSGYIETGDNMFRDCKCITEFYKIKPYIMAGFDVKNSLMKKDYIIDNFKTDTIKILNKLIKSKPYVNIVFFPSSNKCWGSDVIAKYVLRQHINDGETCAVISAKQLLNFFFDFDSSGDENCIEYLKNVQNLLIEGLGLEYNSKMKDSASFVINSLNGFLNERIQNTFNKRTYISLNFTKDVLHKTYSKELTSLIVNKFNGFPVLSKELEDTEYSIAVKKFDGIFEDLDIIKTDRKRK